MDESCLVHPPRQGLLSPPAFVTEARYVCGRVGVVEVSESSRCEISILPLTFLMLDWKLALSCNCKRNETRTETYHFHKFF